MKNFSNNIKYFIFSFTFIIAGFALAHSAHATYTYVQDCLDGGSIASVVNLSPSGPFPANNSSNNTFIASSYINSTCGPRTVKLTAEDNAGPIITLIDAFIGSGTFPSIPASTTFYYPYNPGSYAVHFVTSVEESLPITGFPVDAKYGCGAPVVTYYSAYDPGVNDIEPGMDLWLDPQMQNVVPQGNYMQSAVNANEAYNLVNGHYIDSYGFYSTMTDNTITPC